ncbi:SDR family NAD(P)-dependent oxidoreductase [Streptomyces massasporeus]
MRGRLSERVAVVTGGAGGIGGAVARALSTEGASVVIADVRDAEGTDLAADLDGRAAVAATRAVAPLSAAHTV